MNVKIGSKTIGDGYSPFIIAEAGSNHNGYLKNAKKMVEEAASAGVDAIKFQTFKAEDFMARNSIFFKILKKLELDENDFMEIRDHAKKHKIMFFSTPLSETSTDILSKLKIPVYKIASGDLTHIPLIKYVASKNKPIILSTGMANLDEIKNAVKACLSQKNKRIILMHSVSGYPTPEHEANLNSIFTLKEKFPYPIGYSDNGNGIFVSSLAMSLGANIIEKHFTLNKKMKGPDHAMSADPREIKQLVNNAKMMQSILGDGKIQCMYSELQNKIDARRSITALQEIKKGEKIKKMMIGIKRPAKGIDPIDIDKVVGKITSKKIRQDQPIKWSDLN